MRDLERKKKIVLIWKWYDYKHKKSTHKLLELEGGLVIFLLKTIYKNQLHSYTPVINILKYNLIKTVIYNSIKNSKVHHDKSIKRCTRSLLSKWKSF